MFIVQYLVDLPMSTIVITTNVVNLQWSPSNLHIHLHQSVDVFHPLKTLCHVPFSLLGVTPSIVFPMEMSFIIPPTSTPLVMSHMELSFVVSL